jgi:hypothetical protein
MEFTLYYRGDLKSNGSREDKHAIRKRVHQQLKVLWDHPPVSESRRLLEPDVGSLCLLRPVITPTGRFNFGPLVTVPVGMVAELDIFMLWPNAPGRIITSGGDIDNRLKTLFDALKVPEPNALPSNAAPDHDEDPFLCLLEDDSLIVRLSVQTDRLLEPARKSEVVLTIRVRTRKLGGAVSLHPLTAGLS